jgi:hypothetical protein
VALTERIAEVYLAWSDGHGDALLELRPAPHGRSPRLETHRRLRRQLLEHARAVALLSTHGARWLDAVAHERLEDLARRLVGRDGLTAPELTDRGAS